MLTVGTVVLWSAHARAQQPATARPERPYRGIFGGGVGETEQLLTATLSLGGVALSQRLPADGSASPVGAGGYSTNGQGSGGFSYSLKRSKLDLQASWSMSGRYLPDATPRVMAGDGASVVLGWPLTKHTHIDGSFNGTRQPYSTLPAAAPLFEAEPGSTDTIDLQRVALRESYIGYGAQLGIAHTMNRRLALSGNLAYGGSRYNEPTRDVIRRSGKALATWTIGRGLGLRAGYGRQLSQYRDDEGLVHGSPSESYDAGIDFSRALSFSRKTTLAFSSGSSGVGNHGKTQYQLVGSARLNHEIWRTWVAALTFGRDFSFVNQFREPVLSDSMSAGASGTITRRVQASASIGAAAGLVGIRRGLGVKKDYRSVNTSISLSAAITRYIAVTTHYGHYSQAFATTAPELQNYSREGGRHTFDVNLALWAPLYQRSQRPHASR